MNSGEAGRSSRVRVHRWQSCGVILDLQLSPAQCTWSEYIDAVLAAEAAGFGTVWVLDHLSGVSFDGPTMLECFTLLGSLATATSTLRLGALVANVANRSAGLLAVAASTVQTVSEGRLHLGRGAGTSPRSSFAREQLALGITPASTIAERHQRVVDTLDLFDTMWSTDRDPEHWKGFPLPGHRPPVVLGVNSVRLAVVTIKLLLDMLRDRREARHGCGFFRLRCGRIKLELRLEGVVELVEGDTRNPV